MTVREAEETIRFGVFQFDQAQLRLYKNDSVMRLGHQPAQVLSALVERPGEIVSREELRQRLWGSDVFVDFDHGLNKSVQKLRDVLNDSADAPLYIETIPRIGYRFIAPVIRDPEPASHEPQTVSSRSDSDDPTIPAATNRSIGRLAGFSLVGCLLAGLAAFFWWPRHPEAPPLAAEPMIAVLPILNQTKLAEEDYIADGMTEALIRQLAGLRGLRVIGSASGARFRSTDPDFTTVRNALHVDIIFKGKIHRDRTRMTLAAELLNARDGSVMLARDYLLDENDLSSVQADILHDTPSGHRHRPSDSPQLRAPSPHHKSGGLRAVPSRRGTPPE